MATLYTWSPLQVDFRDSPPANRTRDAVGRWVLRFGDTVNEFCRLQIPVVPSSIDLGGNQTLRAICATIAATTGNAGLEAAVEAKSVSDDLAASFAAAVPSGAVAVPATLGFFAVDIAMSVLQADGLAAGDSAIIRVNRDTAVASNIAEDLSVYAFEWIDNA